MAVFKLPDLGEGLPDAEIVKWHVEEGDSIEEGDVLVEMSTAKAVVEVPAPQSGKVTKLHGGPGDVIDTGNPLVTFDGDEGGEVEIDPDELEATDEAAPARPDTAKDAEQPEEKSEDGAGEDGSDEQVFKLPDLGEGLPDAEIVKWLVDEGDTITENEPMVEMSTAKAVVEVPAPFSGTVSKLYGGKGDVIETGNPLVAISSSGKVAKKKAAAKPKKTEGKKPEKKADSGTVVGDVTVGSEVKSDVSVGRDGVRASAAVRALAKRKKIDITRIKGTGPDGEVRMRDVRAAAEGKAPEEAPVTDAGKRATADNPMGPAARVLMEELGLTPEDVTPTGPRDTITKMDVLQAAKTRMNGGGTAPAAHGSVFAEGDMKIGDGRGVKAQPKARKLAQEKGIDIRKVRGTGHEDHVTVDDINAALESDFGVSRAKAPYRLPGWAETATGEAERLVGPRRVMAQTMAKSNAEICNTTIFDDADIMEWSDGQDITVRIMRSLIAAARTEPSLNAHFDGEAMEKTVPRHVHLGIAVDSPKGLFVPTIKNADSKSAKELRQELNIYRDAIKDGSIQPGDMSGATITLSNFGMIAGRYATPIITPPQVAIVGIGKLRKRLTMTHRGIENRRLIPVSVTFDHRACTGGEAARYLGAVIRDLQLPD